MPLTEHKEPWFMRLNLGEEVPVFIHGDTIVSDYNQIIDYIETNFVGGMADKPLTHDCRKIPCLLLYLTLYGRGVQFCCLRATVLYIV